jgi:membrane-associated phospholipid phosphatase
LELVSSVVAVLRKLLERGDFRKGLGLADQWRLLASNGFSGVIGGSGAIFGTNGFEDVTLLELAGSTVFDPSFNKGGDVIRLVGTAAEWVATLEGSNVVLERGDQTVTLPVGTRGLTLVFGDGSRILSSDGAAVTIGDQEVSAQASALLAPSLPDAIGDPAFSEAAARLLFAANGSATVAGNYDVFGTPKGAEALTVTGGTVSLDPSFARGADTLTIPGSARSYEAAVTSSNVVITGEGTQIVVPIGPEGLSLSFSDGSRMLSVDALLGRVLFGSQTLDGSPASLESAIAAPVDQVLLWNAVALETVTAAAALPTTASRAMAIQAIAVYDALSSVGQLNAYLDDYGVEGSVDLSAVVAYAAHDVLVALFPGQQEAIDARLQQFLPFLGSGASLAAGRELGEAAAAATLQLRSPDGAESDAAYFPNGEPGTWIPESEPEAPQWGAVTPFALEAPDQFRSESPPALSSEAYAEALNQTKELGRIDSSVRSAEKTDIALFWEDGAGTNTLPGHWNVAAQVVSLEERLSISENALTFAMLDIALADAGIATWDAKYEYATWRPQAAIRGADLDGNPLTAADPTWAPLLADPASPGYPSAHAAFSAAAASILTALFGEGYAFNLISQSLPEQGRDYESFEEAALEAANSRIYGGASTSFAVEAGYDLGSEVGNWVVSIFNVLNDPLDSGLLP